MEFLISCRNRKLISLVIACTVSNEPIHRPLTADRDDCEKLPEPLDAASKLGDEAPLPADSLMAGKLGSGLVGAIKSELAGRPDEDKPGTGA